MKVVSFLQRMLLGIVVAVLAGCATGDSFVTKTMSNEDYVKSSQADRAKYRTAVIDEAKAIEEKNAVEYFAQRPVYVGNGKTSFTYQWSKASRQLFIYPGHVPGGMGLETFGAVAFATDEQGKIMYDPATKHPMKVFTNVAMQEDLLRATLKTFAGAVPSAFNGAIAAKIQTDACKEKGCGGGVEFNQEIVSVGMGGQGGRGGSAAAGAYSNSGASVTGGGGCPTGVCKSSLSPY